MSIRFGISVRARVALTVVGLTACANRRIEPAGAGPQFRSRGASSRAGGSRAGRGAARDVRAGGSARSASTVGQANRRPWPLSVNGGSAS